MRNPPDRAAATAIVQPAYEEEEEKVLSVVVLWFLAFQLHLAKKKCFGFARPLAPKHFFGLLSKQTFPLTWFGSNLKGPLHMLTHLASLSSTVNKNIQERNREKRREMKLAIIPPPQA